MMGPTLFIISKGGVHLNLLRGDCFEVLQTIKNNSVDSLVTDPPAGISFMGKEWDHHKGGRKEWVAWMEGVMRECIRVMKPGAHGLVWALPRTSHWTATALEDAGFEIRDVVTHLFGSGFPKSLNVGRQTGIKEHEGLGTALKPASEHWILIRKPCSEKTVAANVLKWGTGALNIDASRIATDDLKGKVYNNNNTGWKCTSAPSTVHGHPTGRFPANLVLSHSEYCTDTQCDIECAVAMLDAQSLAGGMHGAGGSRTKVVESHYNASSFDMSSPRQMNRVGDSGGASRFFFQAKWSKDELCQLQENVMSSASFVRKDSSSHAPLILDFVQRLAAIAEHLEETHLKDLTGLFIADIQSKLSCEPTPSTNLILSTAEKYLHELKHIESWNDSHAKAAELQRLIDITMTTLDLLTFDGYAASVTLGTTPKNLEHGERDSASRFRYCPKVSSSERNAGLDRSELVWKQEAWLKQDLSSRTENISRLARVISDAASLDESSWSTDLYGHSISEQYPTGFKFTTETVIKLITELRTLNSSQPSITSASIQDAIRVIEANGLSLAESAKFISQLSLDSISEPTASLLRVVSALLPDLSVIRSAARSGNFHETVKAQKLMRYLCKMVTPPGGVILDPFMGSGSTGLAAKSEGFKFIGIERELEYYDIAKARLI